MQSAAKLFFTSSHYAVAGASSDPSKFGNKIFSWYLDHSIQPTPLNPRAPSITVRSSTYATARSPAALAPDTASRTSLSIVTPPAATRLLLREAREAGVRAVWLQPGTYDADVLEEAQRLFPGAAVGGFEGLEAGDRHEGWCVLVHGEAAGVGNHRGGREDGKL